MKRLSQDFIRLTPSTRLYHLDRPIVALTGGVATGKSTATRFIAETGIQVIDADALVKSIYQTPEAKEFIRNTVPLAWKTDRIDFPALRDLVFSQEEIKKQVESFIYARLPAAFEKESQNVRDQNFLFYDVPLLFERHLETLVDVKVVVYAPKELQLKRLTERDHSKDETSQRMLKAQLDIEMKKNQADIIINNLGTLQELKENVNQFLKRIMI